MKFTDLLKTVAFAGAFACMTSYGYASTDDVPEEVEAPRVNLTTNTPFGALDIIVDSNEKCKVTLHQTHELVNTILVAEDDKTFNYIALEALEENRDCGSSNGKFQVGTGNIDLTSGNFLQMLIDPDTEATLRQGSLERFVEKYVLKMITGAEASQAKANAALEAHNASLVEEIVQVEEDGNEAKAQRAAANAAALEALLADDAPEDVVVNEDVAVTEETPAPVTNTEPTVENTTGTDTGNVAPTTDNDEVTETNEVVPTDTGNDD